MATPSYDDIIQKDILELLDLQDLPDDKKQEFYQKLYRTVENRTILRLDNLLTESEIDEWKKFLEAGDREAANSYLKGKDIDIQHMMLEETAVLKAQLVFMLDDTTKKQALASAPAGA